MRSRPGIPVVASADATGKRGLVRQAADGAIVRPDPEATEHVGAGADAIARMAGGIASTLNNLLTIIAGHAELMQRDLPEGDPRREHAIEVQRACERGGRLTSQLFAVARGQRGEAPDPLQTPCTVLLVVCDPVLAEFARQVLTSIRCNVFQLRDHAEACAVVVNLGVPVDVLVTDLEADARSRLELRRLLHREHPGLRTLYLVGRGDSVRGLQTDADREAELLIVPFERDELIARMRALAAGRKTPVADQS